MRSLIIIASILISFQTLDCHGAIDARLNFFDIDLLRHFAEGKKGNVMVSPASIKSTLAMLLEGAKGATAAEIKAALRVSPVADDFREELIPFVKSLQVNTSNVNIQRANAVFVSKSLNLRREYEMIVQRMYGSDVGKLDFNDPKSSAQTINAWVKEKTRGLIPTIVDEVQIPPNTEMLLTNALFFKALWKHAFDVKSTHSDCFYNNDICTNVAMMDIQASLKYVFVEELRAHALELPYQGDRYSMVLLMPQDRNGADSLIRDLPYFGLPQISALMYFNDVILTMPKFSVDYNHNMVETLRNMRITSLFSKSANLTGIFDSGDAPFLNSMFHSVHMTVDEAGTVAAAATASLVVPLSNMQVQLRVDRPFLFFIRDNSQGVILFEGKIEEPTAFVETSKVQPKEPEKSQPVPVQPNTSLNKENTATTHPKSKQATSNTNEDKPNLQSNDNFPDWTSFYDYNRHQPIASSHPPSHFNQGLPDRDSNEHIPNRFADEPSLNHPIQSSQSLLDSFKINQSQPDQLTIVLSPPPISDQPIQNNHPDHPILNHGSPHQPLNGNVYVESELYPPYAKPPIQGSKPPPVIVTESSKKKKENEGGIFSTLFSYF